VAGVIDVRTVPAMIAVSGVLVHMDLCGGGCWPGVLANVDVLVSVFVGGRFRLLMLGPAMHRAIHRLLLGGARFCSQGFRLGVMRVLVFRRMIMSLGMVIGVIGIVGSRAVLGHGRSPAPCSVPRS